MSNLFKGGYIVQKEETRIIDYNDLVASKIKKLSEESNFVPAKGFATSEQQGEAGFVQGLHAEELEVVLEEEQEAEISPELSPEQLLEEARKEAEKLLEDARTEGEMIRNEAYETAKKKGYDDGYRQGMAETDQMKEQLKEHQQALELDYNTKLEEMEPVVVEKVADLMEYVFRIQFSTSRAMIMHILAGALGKINISKEFAIHISREDVAVVKANHDKILAMVPNAVSVEIIEDPALVKNQCQIETDGGIFDCSLDTQMEKLIKSIKTLSYAP